MLNKQSILGYSKGSPYANSPFLDIFTPEGVIDMSKTDKDLLGIDETGHTQMMKANSKNPYLFPGQNVREIPMQDGGSMNPYAQQALSYIFDDEEEEEVAPPSQDEELVEEKNARIAMVNDDQSDLAMEQAMMENPYRSRQQDNWGDGLDLNVPYTQENLHMQPQGMVGERGQQIISDISSSLGYVPKFNSIRRTPEKQQELINQGLGVKNSYHLTGDAVDMKPADWNRLTDERKNHFRSNYDVVYHNNHYHIEPKD